MLQHNVILRLSWTLLFLNSVSLTHLLHRLSSWCPLSHRSEITIILAPTNGVGIAFHSHPIVLSCSHTLIYPRVHWYLLHFCVTACESSRNRRVCSIKLNMKYRVVCATLYFIVSPPSHRPFVYAPAFLEVYPILVHWFQLLKYSPCCIVMWYSWFLPKVVCFPTVSHFCRAPVFFPWSLATVVSLILSHLSLVGLITKMLFASILHRLIVHEYHATATVKTKRPSDHDLVVLSVMVLVGLQVCHCYHFLFVRSSFVLK